LISVQLKRAIARLTSWLRKKKRGKKPKKKKNKKNKRKKTPDERGLKIGMPGELR